MNFDGIHFFVEYWKDIIIGRFVFSSQIIKDIPQVIRDKYVK